MNDLIEELKREHQLIASHLADANKLGVDTREGTLSLMKAKSALLAHLKKEDERLYPVLRRAAQKDRRLQWMLELYAQDMEEVSSAAVVFFQKYENGGKGIEFIRDFGTLLARLKIRIRNEEGELYREYEAITSGKPVERDPSAPFLIGEPKKV